VFLKLKISSIRVAREGQKIHENPRLSLSEVYRIQEAATGVLEV